MATPNIFLRDSQILKSNGFKNQKFFTNLQKTINDWIEDGALNVSGEIELQDNFDGTAEVIVGSTSIGTVSTTAPDTDFLTLSNQIPSNINEDIYTLGRLGINTNFPTSTLDINGNVRIRNIPTVGTPTFSLGVDSSGNIQKYTPSGGGSSNSFEPTAFKQNATGYFQITVPYNRTNFSIKIKIYRHGIGLSEYDISGYLNNGWIQTYATKTAQGGSPETVTLTDNGGSDYRIYIGDNNTTWRGIHTLFVVEAYRPGTFTMPSSVQTDLSVFNVSVENSISGTIKATL